MTETLYPVFYQQEMVTFATLVRIFTPHMHPEAARRGFRFIYDQGGKFGIGGGYRPPGKQPDGKPGFAPPGSSFHEGQQFPSGLYYVAWDMVCVNPGKVHRTPQWNEVPAQGTAWAEDCGMHMNVPKEPWHMQPVELDGYLAWVVKKRFDIQYNYPIAGAIPPPVPGPAPTPTPQGDDMYVRLYVLRDSDAQFLAETDKEGQALIVTWAGPGSPAVDKAVAAHRAEAARKGFEFEVHVSVADMYNCCYFGDELPYGDSKHTWVKTDFWRTVGVKS